MKTFASISGSLRLSASDSSFSTRLSEMGLGLGDRKGPDATFTVDGNNTSASSGSLDRSQTNSLAVDEPSILPNAFSSADSSSSEAVIVASSALTSSTTATSATTVMKKAAAVASVVGATGGKTPPTTADVNHNTSNGCARATTATSAGGVVEDNGSLE